MQLLSLAIFAFLFCIFNGASADLQLKQMNHKDFALYLFWKIHQAP